MSRVAVAAALWLACSFVIWNVIYDRYIAVAAVEFTREQVRRSQQGEPVVSIHDGFSPRVGDAAWRATLWVTPVIAAGIVTIYLTFRAEH